MIQVKIKAKKMTKQELIKELEKLPDDKVVVMSFADGGWSNIETVEYNGGCIEIKAELYPVFSDS